MTARRGSGGGGLSPASEAEFGGQGWRRRRAVSLLSCGGGKRTRGAEEARGGWILEGGRGEAEGGCAVALEASTRV
jgi:hypothetical protein